jgi:hypothetical protein
LERTICLRFEKTFGPSVAIVHDFLSRTVPARRDNGNHPALAYFLLPGAAGLPEITPVRSNLFHFDSALRNSRMMAQISTTSIISE